jgi:hypothetical protein
MKLATREFSYADQEHFASVSGDCNPIHVNSVQARRTQAGAPVVHGINLLLWGLEALAAARPGLPPLRSLQMRSNKFVYLGESADVVFTEPGPGTAQLNVSVEGALRSKVTIEFGDAVDDCPGWSVASLAAIPSVPAPLDLAFEDIAGRSGRISFATTPEDAVKLFPSAAKWLGGRRIAMLMASTCLVGMVCPGLHSIYGELSVKTCAELDLLDSLAFRVVWTDPRFHAVDQEITGGGLTGTVKSFFRTPPVQQPGMESLAGLIGKTDFADSIALIVGGSRGLGELTAKAIATGGGRVIITWKTGQDDAERVVQEIRSAGGACEAVAYDVHRPAAGQLATLDIQPTHAYYFATPTIYRPQASIFAAERLKDFLAVYVEGFWHLAQALRARQPRLSLFYPSSTFVTERPRGMAEYAMAKAAGEVLCTDMNRSLAPMHVTLSRLPRLPTDQTASVTVVEMADALEALLPNIREVQSWPR